MKGFDEMVKENEELDRYVTIWAKAVDTQMHFNEMSVKSRQLGLTFVTAALGVAIVLLTRGDDFSIPIDLTWLEFHLHITVILVLAAIFALKAVQRLDLNVYHRMLRGAVTFGEDFEEQYMKRIFRLEKGMTQAISHYSRFKDAKSKPGGAGKSYVYSGEKRSTAEDKIKSFYSYTLLFLCGAALVLFVLTNWQLWFGTNGAST